MTATPTYDDVLRFAWRDVIRACRERTAGLRPIIIAVDDHDVFEADSNPFRGSTQRRLRSEVGEWCAENTFEPYTLDEVVFAADHTTGTEYSLFVASFDSGVDAALFELRWGHA